MSIATLNEPSREPSDPRADLSSVLPLTAETVDGHL